MIKTFIVDKTDVNMRIDRLLRSKLGKIPQSLIEKSLRNGKIKLNKKKVKSSYKVNPNDKIELFNLNFKEEIIQKKIKFKPSDKIIKSNEDLIIDNNDNFIVLNKSSGISVQGGTRRWPNPRCPVCRRARLDASRRYSSREWVSLAPPTRPLLRLRGLAWSGPAVAMSAVV